MTDQIETAEHPKPARKAPSKAFSVQKLLARPKGASLAEMMTATGWLPHSARAFMTGLRKKGVQIDRECRVDGETAWRITK